MQKLRDLKNAQAGNSWFWVPWILPHIGGLVTLMLIQIRSMIYMSDTVYYSLSIFFSILLIPCLKWKVGALVYQFMVALHHP